MVISHKTISKAFLLLFISVCALANNPKQVIFIPLDQQRINHRVEHLDKQIRKNRILFYSLGSIVFGAEIIAKAPYFIAAGSWLLSMGSWLTNKVFLKPMTTALEPGVSLSADQQPISVNTEQLQNISIELLNMAAQIPQSQQTWFEWAKDIIISKNLWQTVGGLIIANSMFNIIQKYIPYLMLGDIRHFIACRAPFDRYIKHIEQQCLILKTVPEDIQKQKYKDVIINDIRMCILAAEQLLVFTQYKAQKAAFDRKVALESIITYIYNYVNQWITSIEQSCNSVSFDSEQVSNLARQLNAELSYNALQIRDIDGMHNKVYQPIK